ncbi:MAG TPA: ABC transporter ATP-binding protein [Ktedonobacteraceae bacterium]|nr:ABC transporter ATP-binding protein [Ktedonobacteraceae bacterium]
MGSVLRPSITSYRDLFVTYLKPQWLRVMLMAVLLLTSIGLQLVNPQILRYFIDTVTSGGNLNPLLLAGAIFVAISLVNQAISVWATYVSENVAWTATNQLRTDLVAHCLGLDMAFHKARTAGELIERIDGDVDTLSNFFSQSVIHLLGNGILIVGIIVLLFSIDWRVGLAMGSFALLTLVGLTHLRGYALGFWTADRQKDAEFFGFLGEQLAGTEDVRANGASSYVMQRFYLFIRQWLPLRRKADLSGYSMWMTMLLVFAIGNVLGLALGAYLWSTRSITLGTVYLIFYYINLLNDPIDNIRVQLQQLQQAGAGIERVKELFQFQPTINDGNGQMLPQGALAVAFCDVSFGYNHDDTILHHLSFDLQPGKVLGVLGRTGSGKTTLARLILRLYDVQEGEVCIGGRSVQALKLADLRQHIGMVTQDVQLFHASVRDNLTLFNRAISDSHILEALDDLGLSPWYRSLPEGLDTELGSDGEGLSAGEAQLLAFTRVFLTNPGLVILDEASSRLDPATEQLIERAVSKLLAGRTGIVIAHRLATIQRADDIMVLENGRIIEHGERAALATDPASRFYHLLQTGLEEVRA